MRISKEELRLLRLANRQQYVEFEEPAVQGNLYDVHAAYHWDNITSLEKRGYVAIYRNLDEESGIEISTFRITPAGQAYLEERKERILDSWITRIIAIVSLVVSIITAITK